MAHKLDYLSKPTKSCVIPLELAAALTLMTAPAFGLSYLAFSGIRADDWDLFAIALILFAVGVLLACLSFAVRVIGLTRKQRTALWAIGSLNAIELVAAMCALVSWVRI